MTRVTVAEYRKNPGAALDAARKQGQVDVTNDDGSTRFVLAFPDPPKCDSCESGSIARVKGVCGGRPTLVGRRITPADVIGRLESGEGPEVVRADFELTTEQMRLVVELWRDLRRTLRACGWSKLTLRRRGGTDDRSERR